MVPLSTLGCQEQDVGVGSWVDGILSAATVIGGVVNAQNAVPVNAVVYKDDLGNIGLRVVILSIGNDDIEATEDVGLECRNEVLDANH